MKVKNGASGTSEKSYNESGNQLRDMDFRSSGTQVRIVEVLVGSSVSIGVGRGVGENYKR